MLIIYKHSYVLLYILYLKYKFTYSFIKQKRIMKTQFFLALTVILSTLLVFSCNDATIVNQLDSKSNLPANSLKEVNESNIQALIYEGYDKDGRFVYDHIKKHLASSDPYDMLSEKDREPLKAKFASVQNSPNKRNGEHWDEALQAHKISHQLYDFLKSSDATLKSNIQNGYDKAETDQWFVAQIEQAKKLDAKERNFAVNYMTIMRYAVKTAYEAVPQPQLNSKARLASSNCTVQQITCAAGTIGTYSGIGALFGGPGSIIGAVVGAFISIGNCPCDSNPCQYAVYVSTPDVCYNQYGGLTFQVAGYGNAPNGFRYELYKSDNLSVANQLAVHVTNNNSTTFSDAELQGNSVVYIYVATNCGSGSLNYQPTSTAINIPYLGQPSFTMTGNTSPYVTAYEGYNLVGRNIQNTSWNIWTYGPTNGTFINQYSTSAVVQWNSVPGYAHITADANTSCGAYNNGLYVSTHN